MTPALYGFIGVIAGAVLTGAVQSVIAWRDRVRARQTAARLIWGDLVLASSDLNGFIDHHHGWPDSVWNLPTYTDTWNRHAEAYANVGSAPFHTVAGAFRRIETLISIRSLSISDPDLGWGQALLRVSDDIAVIDRAADVALITGMTWLERRKGMTHWEKWLRGRQLDKPQN